jgi:hypothetical protein
VQFPGYNADLSLFSAANDYSGMADLFGSTGGRGVEPQLQCRCSGGTCCCLACSPAGCSTTCTHHVQS